MAIMEQLHLNHNSSSPILVELTNSIDPAESSLMDICCAVSSLIRMQCLGAETGSSLRP